ncbi:MAG: trimethylamine methyltransferase family protein [Armatimonadota bacterium]
MSPEEAQRIHDTSLRILDEIGLRLEHDGIAALLLKAGARPGPGTQEVRFPPEMVREYSALAPETIELAARDGSSVTLTPESAPAFWTNPGMYIWDGVERRSAVAADLAGVARLCDNLRNVQGVMGMAMADVPPPCRDFVGLRVIAENCRKHVRVLCFSPTGMEAIAAVKPLFPGPWFSMGFTAHGPLRWTHLALEIFQKSAGHRIPVTINGEPMAGVTGPVSLAGSMAVGNAEILAGIIINQLLEPGRPVIYNLGLAHTFDMRNATAVTGGPENALFARASAAMGRYYRLPSSSWVSTEAVLEDEQAGLEKMFGFETHMREQVGVIWGMGQLESEMTMSPAQLVIDNEMIDYIRHYECGYRVDDETMQFELIREIGIAGSYLEAEDTLLHFREHLFQPAVLNRKSRESCPQPLAETARQQAAEMVAADAEEKIPAAVAAELRRIEATYRQRLQ